MCGIAGVLYRDGRSADPAVLSRMGNTLHHRGPDDSGVCVFEGGGFAFRRLAIIDLSPAAAQPFGLPEAPLWLVFNGEIYNFRELRKELEAKGHAFRSHGDAEVILRMYLEEGARCVAKLDGMFAFAIWDGRIRELILARDRSGKKPLHVYEDDEKVIFGSEIKAILAHPGVDTSYWPPAFSQYLTLGYVPTPHTFYRRIRKLPPATVQQMSAASARVPERYWRLPTESGKDVLRAKSVSVSDAQSQLRSLFSEAVRRRLVSDVPLGAFLSGGIDSTLIVAEMHRLGVHRIKTFSLGFGGDSSFDETHYARLVARQFNTDHTEFTVQPDSYSLIESLSLHYDEPFGDSSAIPTYLVSKLSREQVTVALTGDGGDELFAGYGRFKAALYSEGIPRWARHALGIGFSGLPHQAPGTKGRLASLQRFASALSLSLSDRMARWSSFLEPSQLGQLLSPELLVDADNREQFFATSFPHDGDPLNAALHVNFETYLLDDLNVKMDRASMAASLETRAPFLDTALIEFAFRLPGRFKIRRGETKWILKRAYQGVLPAEILRRKKMGFSMPLAAWFRGPLRSFVSDRLLSASSGLYPFLRRETVERLFRDHLSGGRDHGQFFWLLSMLELWLSRRSLVAESSQPEATVRRAGLA